MVKITLTFERESKGLLNRCSCRLINFVSKPQLPSFDEGTLKVILTLRLEIMSSLLIPNFGPVLDSFEQGLKEFKEHHVKEVNKLHERQAKEVEEYLLESIELTKQFCDALKFGLDEVVIGSCVRNDIDGTNGYALDSWKSSVNEGRHQAYKDFLEILTVKRYHHKSEFVKDKTGCRMRVTVTLK